MSSSTPSAPATEAEVRSVGALMTPRIVVMFALFILLGLPEGVLGVAWPSIRADFGRPDSGLAQLVTAYIVGYLVFTSFSGRLTARFGTLGLSQIGVGCTVVGLAGYSLAPGWWLLAAFGFVLGGGAGVVDSSLNAEVALTQGPRVMNLLHAFFGVGATLGPLLMTLIIGTNVSWRLAYVLLVVLEVGLFVALWKVRGGPRRKVTTPPVAAQPERLGTASSPQLVQAALLIYFAVYVATEVSIGHWGFSVLEQRYSEVTAGLIMAGYWGGLMAGRFALGALDDRLAPRILLRASVALAVVAVGWFWIVDGTAELIGLPIAGVALAGIFPALVLMTPVWLGDRRVSHAVGYQLAASSGGAVIAAQVLGRVADTSGLDAIPQLLAGLAALLACAHLLTESLTYGLDHE